MTRTVIPGGVPGARVAAEFTSVDCRMAALRAVGVAAVVGSHADMAYRRALYRAQASTSDEWVVDVSQLAAFLEEQRRNDPDGVYSLLTETDAHGREYLLATFCMTSWQRSTLRQRRVVSIDAAATYGAVRPGSMLAGALTDANGSPAIVFAGLIYKEDMECWSFVVDQLVAAVGTPLGIVADSHRAIVAACTGRDGVHFAWCTIHATRALHKVSHADALREHPDAALSHASAVQGWVRRRHVLGSPLRYAAMAYQHRVLLLHAAVPWHSVRARGHWNSSILTLLRIPEQPYCLVRSEDLQRSGLLPKEEARQTKGSDTRRQLRLHAAIKRQHGHDNDAASSAAAAEVVGGAEGSVEEDRVVEENEEGEEGEEEEGEEDIEAAVADTEEADAAGKSSENQSTECSLAADADLEQYGQDMDRFDCQLAEPDEPEVVPVPAPAEAGDGDEPAEGWYLVSLLIK